MQLKFCFASRGTPCLNLMRDYLLKKSYDLYVGKKGAAKTC